VFDDDLTTCFFRFYPLRFKKKKRSVCLSYEELARYQWWKTTNRFKFIALLESQTQCGRQSCYLFL